MKKLVPARIDLVILDTLIGSKSYFVEALDCIHASPLAALTTNDKSTNAPWNKPHFFKSLSFNSSHVINQWSSFLDYPVFIYLDMNAQMPTFILMQRVFIMEEITDGAANYISINEINTSTKQTAKQH